MGTKDIAEERYKLALSVIDDIDWDIYPVEHDDYGDTQWKWNVVFHIVLDEVWYELGSDYYRTQPNDREIYNNLLEMIKDGGMGDYIADILTQHNKGGVNGKEV